MRIHTSPSIQINEIDKSQYSVSMTGTHVYIQGFTAKGEPYKPMDITSRTAFTAIYGEPTTEAERYAFAAVVTALDNSAHVCFARLPYSNDSFEKLLAHRYTVSKCQGKEGEGKPLSETEWAAVAKADPEIQQYCKITAQPKPFAIDLATVEEYRTDEATVAANSFLIVDTTGATLGKVQEDWRKGDKRELIGITPVVTTAANALLAQSMITVENREVSAYESVGASASPKQLNTISADGKDYALLESDLTQMINTQGFYWNQKYDFTSKGIVKTISPSDVDFGPTIKSWFNKCEEFIDKYHYKYFLNSLADMRDFYNGVKDDEHLGPEFQPIVDDNKIGELREACKKLIDAIDTVEQWMYEDDIGNQIPIAELFAEGTGYVGGPDFETLTANFNKQFTSLPVDERPPLFAITSSYIDESTVHPYVGGDDDITFTAQLMLATDLPGEGEWHGKTGDDSLPNSMCQNANDYFSAIQPAQDGDGFDPEHLKDIGVVVFKTYLDPSEGNKVSYEPVEAFCGSLCKTDVDPNTGVTKFIDTIINSQSEYINFFSNCFSSTSRKREYQEDVDILIAEPSYAPAFGFFERMTKKDISINSSILDGMNKAYAKVTDVNERDIDIIPDAGLANIASYLKAIYGDKGEYDLTVTDDIGNSLLSLWKCKEATSPAVKMWKTIEQKIDNFCKNVRKDCMFTADSLRPLVLQGQKKVIRDSKPSNTLDKDVLPYLKCIAGLNTSYGAGYMDWFEQADDYSGDFFWCPPSIKAMGVYINTDVNYNYWDAPAGLNRGVIPCTDVAFSPTAFQADLIYDKCWNYAINYPNEGVVLEGQKTFQVKTSALDRVNVRRLMLRLERATYKAMRWFMYEGNTAYLRQRVVDALDPYFKQAKVGGGLYDYVIKCDETNNTPETIDNNELHVSIGVKPVRSVEYIMVDFIVGRTGSSWAELGL